MQKPTDIYATVDIPTEHPHIVRRADVLSGEPIIQGTRTTVRAIAECSNLDLTPEQVCEGLPHVSLAQVFDALSYYHDHRAEIDAHIEANRVLDVERGTFLAFEELGKQEVQP